MQSRVPDPTPIQPPIPAPAPASVPAPHPDRAASGISSPIPQRDAGEYHVDRDATHIAIRFTTATEHLRTVRLMVEEFSKSAGFDDAACSEIGFVINEAVANVIRHAYDADRPMPIDLTATVSGDAMTIEIRDWGRGTMPKMDHHHTFADTVAGSGVGDTVPEPGGLGLVCMQRIMDDVAFIPQSPGMLLRLRRSKAHQTIDWPTRDMPTRTTPSS